MICTYCGSTYGKKNGVCKDEQRWRCHSCAQESRYPYVEEPEYLPKILLFDIETSLMEVYVWGLYKQFIPHTNIIKDENGNDKTWYMISWAAKWLFDKKVMGDCVTPEESVKRDDSRILMSIWDLLNEADIVIAHNGDSFDIRKLNARFLEHEIPAPLPYKSIDTLKVARREFALVSYKQDYLTKHFKLNNKLKTEFQLWVDCMHGDEDALKKMAKYNKHDVIGLEEVYLKMRPYMKNHPNIGVLKEEDVCTVCGSKHLEETDAIYLTSASKFLVYRCNSCKSPYIRSKKNVSNYKTNMRSVST